jgi:hypothetical protein
VSIAGHAAGVSPDDVVNPIKFAIVPIIPLLTGVIVGSE